MPSENRVDSVAVAVQLVPMKIIPLTKGKNAFVSDEDFVRISQFKWQARRDAKSKQDLWYAVRGTGPSFTTMHKFVMGGPWHDHKDGNGLNNQRENLRPCTRSQNMANRRKQKGCTSDFKGVCREGDLWAARIRYNGKRTTLGRFDIEEDAAHAYNNAAKACFGEFAKLNDLPPPSSKIIMP